MLTPTCAWQLLGSDWVLSSMWSNIVGPGGQVQVMHTDQGSLMPRYHSRAEAMANGGRVPPFFGGAQGYSADVFKRGNSNTDERA